MTKHELMASQGSKRNTSLSAADGALWRMPSASARACARGGSAHPVHVREGAKPDPASGSIVVITDAEIEAARKGRARSE